MGSNKKHSWSNYVVKRIALTLLVTGALPVFTEKAVAASLTPKTSWQQIENLDNPCQDNLIESNLSLEQIFSLNEGVGGNDEIVSCETCGATDYNCQTLDSQLNSSSFYSKLVNKVAKFLLAELSPQWQEKLNFPSLGLHHQATLASLTSKSLKLGAFEETKSSLSTKAEITFCTGALQIDNSNGLDLSVLTEEAIATEEPPADCLEAIDREIARVDNELAHPAPETERVTSPFGWRRRPYSGQIQFHKGIDYGAPLNSPVVAIRDGVVVRVVSGCFDFGNRFCGSQFGNWIEIDHGDGMIGLYAHLRQNSITVKEGMKVGKNQQIAKVGSSGWSTGAHLDFRLKIDKQYQDPQNFIKDNREDDLNT